MDLLLAAETTTPVAATTPPPLQYQSLLQDGLSVPYENAYGVASLLARDFSLAFFFIMTSYRGRTSFPKALFHCDFEDGWCPGFRPSNNSDIPWNLWKGDTPSNKTGPSVDHTRFNKDGTYVYMEASGVRMGDTAVFKTPPVMMLEHPFYCLRYWYHMRGIAMGSIWVFWNAATGVYKIHSMVDKQSGVQSRDGEDWKESQVQLTSSSETKYYRPVTFEFRAIRAYGYTSDIAIDDIVLLPGKCDEIKLSKTATTMTFRGITTTPQPDTTTTLSWKATNPDFASCGKRYYKVKKQICCLEKIGRKPTHHHRCCGSRVFHQIYEKCCNGYPIKYSEKGCCGKQLVYTKKTRGCCANYETYDLKSEECFKGKVRTKRPKKKRPNRNRGVRSVGVSMKL